jgi:hypothetical protein
VLVPVFDLLDLLAQTTNFDKVHTAVAVEAPPLVRRCHVHRVSEQVGKFLGGLFLTQPDRLAAFRETMPATNHDASAP